MKAFIQWLKGKQSDFLLFIIALVLLNLVSARSFFRLDFTSPKSYSLSQASRQLVRTLEQPLSVKVFFSSNLPSPYNSTAQYIRDLLSEYAGAANKNFSWESFNMDDPENQAMARDYRLNQVQIQEVKDNEVGFKNVWMGIALTYADRIETLDGITSSDGLEYKLTMKMAHMINAVSALAGLKGKAELTLYLSPELADFNIQGFSSIEDSVGEAFKAVNEKNMNRMEYRTVHPAKDEVEKIGTQYGLPLLRWTNNKDGSTGSALIGLVLSYGDSFRIIPLEMQSLFGTYIIGGLDDLEQNLSDNLSSLVSRSETIGYTAGHGELSLQDSQSGAANFASSASDMYVFKEIRTAEEAIPSNISTLIINGPTERFTDEELYKIDQFVMKGGRLAVFIDPYKEEQNEMAMYYGMPPSYIKNETGLEKLLNAYGIETAEGYVMDTQCYTSNQAGSGKVNFYYAPLIHQSGLAKKQPITANLSYVLFLQSGALSFTDGVQNDKEIDAKVLAKTSAKSWIQTDISVLSPSYIFPPAQDKMSEHNLAVLAEGSFRSAFDSSVSGGSHAEQANRNGALSADAYIAKSVQKTRIFAAGTSKITSGALIIDTAGSQPVAMFVRNAIDYLTGNEDLCAMRTKGLSLSVLNNATASSAAFAKIVNQYVLPLLVVAAGFTGRLLRNRRRRKIKERYEASAKDETK